jgi:hypothetical protein
MSGATRTAIARGGRGMSFIKRQEIQRIRRLQNISGPGVAVSSRGITIGVNEKRPIPPPIPPVEYNGPWSCSVSDNIVTVGNGIAPNSISFGSRTMSADQLTYDIDDEFTGDPNITTLTLSVRLRFIYRDLDRGYVLGDAKAGVFNNVVAGEFGQYPIFQYPHDAAQIFYMPVCTLTLGTPTSSRTVISVDTIQYGTAFFTPSKSNLRYSRGSESGALDLIYYGNYGGAGTNFHSIDIPFGSGAPSQPISIWQDPTQFSDSLTTTPPSGNDSPTVLVAQISTDADGNLTALEDWTQYSPYNRGFLEDTIITDVHNSLP